MKHEQNSCAGGLIDTHELGCAQAHMCTPPPTQWPQAGLMGVDERASTQMGPGHVVPPPTCGVTAPNLAKLKRALL